MSSVATGMLFGQEETHLVPFKQTASPKAHHFNTALQPRTSHGELALFRVFKYIY